jgi:hypothetical protein
MLQMVMPTMLLVVDSTLFVDLLDGQAIFGYTSRGKFRGFKLHSAVNQLGLPLRAVVSNANQYDSTYFSELIWDLKANYVLVGASIDCKEVVKQQNRSTLSLLL